ncbi:glycoside hydrolase family 88 protein [Actinotalea ferrariae]|uniref:glycoside hydrolase family 88 protein n=1 Tax=Actinotalea ferrariae TaxID=1386098 RepID=UPI001C8B6B2E|nr:glycoside hydrolase family 88 protein [Actinotalea ferrariae]MBX9245039.1 glycoside hydrolase family 88 protein [Actinotalea ferrariae]
MRSRHPLRPRRRTGVGLALALTAALAASGASAAATAPAAGAVLPVSGTLDVPTHAAVLEAARRAADYYAPTWPLATGARNGWSWATYADGATRLFTTAGDQRYLEQAVAWGTRSGWAVPCSSTLNPDCIKAGQVYMDLTALDPRPSLAAMDAQMARDLTGLPLSQYYWVDALYMGLPDWAHWAERTGSTAYLDKMDALFAHVRDDGWTTTFPCTAQQRGLYDATERLWYRDCRFVGTRDSSGGKVFWGRGNGWVIAAMAQVLETLPPGDPRGATYRDVLVGMADRLRTLQGADGMWRPSLLNPGAFPQPETSATGLIAYAIGYGVRTGVLDPATYLPVLVRAWQGLTTTALKPSGFVSGCQFVGFEPAAPYTGAAPRTAPTTTSAGTLHTDSPPFCVGAFLLAASEMARLTGAASTGRSVSATAQQAGNEAARAVDGDMTTRWSAAGFPQSLTVDLGVAQRVSNVQLVPYEDRAYRYRVETSVDGVAWAPAVDRTTAPVAGTALDTLAAPANARYVRLTVTGVVGTSTTWVSIRELSVHDSWDPRPNLAYLRPATATSSVASTSRPAKAVDNLTTTSWGSLRRPTAAAPQELTVDLGRTESVDTVRLTSRPGAGPRDVALLTSTDASTWVVTATATLPAVQGPHTWVLPDVDARWVRLRVTSAYGTAGVRVEELDVFGR